MQLLLTGLQKSATDIPQSVTNTTTAPPTSPLHTTLQTADATYSLEAPFPKSLWPVCNNHKQPKKTKL